jgi:hypothetical protein
MEAITVILVAMLALVVMSVLFALLIPEYVQSNDNIASDHGSPEPERSLNWWIFLLDLFHLNLMLG